MIDDMKLSGHTFVGNAGNDSSSSAAVTHRQGLSLMYVSPSHIKHEGFDLGSRVREFIEGIIDVLAYD
eukprot:6076-Heterococcus_DN1.PRE.1